MTSLQIILSLLGLLGAVFAWWVKSNDEKNKRTDELDKKIDESSDADDIMHNSGELR